MKKSHNELTKDTLNPQIGLGMGTALTVGMAIGMVRRNLMIGLVIAFMVGGILVLYNRRRLETE